MFLYFYIVLLYFFVTKWSFQAPIYLGCYFGIAGILNGYASVRSQYWPAHMVSLLFPVLNFGVSYVLERQSIKLFLQSQLNGNLYEEIKEILLTFPEAICLKLKNSQETLFQNEAFHKIVLQTDSEDTDEFIQKKIFRPYLEGELYYSYNDDCDQSPGNANRKKSQENINFLKIMKDGI